MSWRFTALFFFVVSSRTPLPLPLYPLFIPGPPRTAQQLYSPNLEPRVVSEPGEPARGGEEGRRRGIFEFLGFLQTREKEGRVRGGPRLKDATYLWWLAVVEVLAVPEGSIDTVKYSSRRRHLFQRSTQFRGMRPATYLLIYRNATNNWFGIET